MFNKKHRSTPSHHSFHRSADGAEAPSKSSGSSYDNLHHKSPYFKRPPNFYQLFKTYPQLFCKEQGINAVDITPRKKVVSEGKDGMHGQTDIHTMDEDVTDFPTTETNKDDDSDSISLWVDHKHKRCRINWKNIPVMKALTQAMLLQDFQLSIHFPDQYLIPPLPNRINYLCWLSDLFESCQAMVGSNPQDITVMDIGTGSSLIYPFLGCRLFGFQFIGSDINPEAIAFASKNLQENIDKVSVLVDSSTSTCRSKSDESIPTNGNLSQSKIRLIQVFDSNALQEAIQMCSAASSSASSSTISWMLSNNTSDVMKLKGPIRSIFQALGDNFQYRLMDCEYQWQQSNNQRAVNRIASTTKSRRRDEVEEEEGECEMDLGDGDEANNVDPVVMRWKPLVFAVMTNPPFYDIHEQVN
jgi:predicted RNA methylase